ncbi:MAG: zinc ribbon domain-containing protein [Anaerolineae bacterium]|jgi:putative FmdB family regulatory protein
MPLYEYECESCGVRFERRQHMEDEPVEVCPECSGNVHRLIQPVGIIFKGSGFYVTDNRAKSPTATPGSTKESADKPAESSGTSSTEETTSSAS